MCGRYATTKSARAHVRALRADRSSLPELPESWNVCPTSTSLVVRQAGRDRALEDWLAWGLEDARAVPRFFNAKAETADELPTFREAWADRRCVVPVDGWYEWRELSGAKQPYFFHEAEGGPLFLAGLWERRSFTLLTMPADGTLAAYHHRRPVGLGVQAAQDWIGGTPESWRDLAQAAIPGGAFAVRPVSRRVNKAGEDGPELMERVEVEQGLEQGSLFLG